MASAIQNNTTPGGANQMSWPPRVQWTAPMLLLTSLALASSTVLLVMLRRRYLSPISNIPGPFWASCTRLWHLKQLWAGDAPARILAAHDRFGPFVRIAHDEVSVSHPEAIRKILIRALPKGPFYSTQAMPDGTLTGMALADPKAKVEFSKFMNPAMAQSSIIRSEQNMDETFEKLLALLDEHAASGRPMALDHYLHFAAVDAVGEVLFSKPYGFLDAREDIGGSLSMLQYHSMYCGLIGQCRWIHWLLVNPYMAKGGPMGHLYDRTMTYLEERQKNPDARWDVVAQWFVALERAKKEQSPYFNEAMLRGELAGVVGAGGDTMAATLQSFLYHSIRHPTAWARLRDEVDAAVRERGLCQDRVVSYRDAMQLPYLQAAVNEAMRVFPGVPYNLPRVVPKGGITIGDKVFPEGTILSVNPWVVHHSKELWGEDARVFEPERWLQPEASQKEKYFVPFGIGYAACPGQHIARTETSKFLATIVRDYDIRLVDPKQSWKWQAGLLAATWDWPVYVTKRIG